MRKIVLAAAVAASPLTGQAADTYTIDPGHTYANFTILHLGFSTMYGRINSVGGEFTLDKDAGTGSVRVELDPSTVDTGHVKRDESLRGPDFLSVEEFPEMSYESTSVALDANGGTIEGNLTLKGQTKPVILQVTRWHCGEHPFNKKPTCGFDATANIKRSDFGVSYGIPNVSDEMTLMIEIEGSIEG